MERDVVVSDPEAAGSSSTPASSSYSSFAETRVICRVCQKQFAQYTCPRCNARYCSLSCYKGHSVQCTESFMRENVMDELKQMQPEDESKKKMLDILKRLHLEEEMESDGEDESMLSEELIQKVMSGVPEGVTLLEFEPVIPEEDQEQQEPEDPAGEGVPADDLPECPDHRPSTFLKDNMLYQGFCKTCLHPAGDDD